MICKMAIIYIFLSLYTIASFCKHPPKPKDGESVGEVNKRYRDSLNRCKAIKKDEMKKVSSKHDEVIHPFKSRIRNQISNKISDEHKKIIYRKEATNTIKAILEKHEKYIEKVTDEYISFAQSFKRDYPKEIYILNGLVNRLSEKAQKSNLSTIHLIINEVYGVRQKYFDLNYNFLIKIRNIRVKFESLNSLYHHSTNSLKDFMQKNNLDRHTSGKVYIEALNSIESKITVHQKKSIESIARLIDKLSEKEDSLITLRATELTNIELKKIKMHSASIRFSENITKQRDEALAIPIFSSKMGVPKMLDFYKRVKRFRKNSILCEKGLETTRLGCFLVKSDIKKADKLIKITIPKLLNIYVSVLKLNSKLTKKHQEILDEANRKVHENIQQSLSDYDLIVELVEAL